MQDSQKPNSTISEKLSKWLSFTGRINQKEFWFYYVLPFVLLNLLPIPFSSLFSIWILLAGLAKRFHDSDISFKKKLVPFSIVGIVGMVILAIVLVILFIVTLMGAMTGSVSSNDFSDGFANVFRIIFGIPFLALVIISIYAGLKPSSPGDNKYGAPPPPIVLSKRYKLVMVASIMVSIASIFFWGIGGLSLSDTDNSYKADVPDDPELIRVIKEDDVKGLQTLLENGEDPNQKSAQGSTALMISSYEAAKLLLEYGADPNINFKYGDYKHTPLVIKAGESLPSIELVELMLEKGANPNPPIANYYEDSPLMALIKNKPFRDEHVAVVKLLLTHGTDPNLLENQKAIHILLKKGGRLEIIKLLLDHGSNLSTRSNQKAFEYALNYASTNVLSLFLEYDLSPEQIRMAKKYVDKRLGQLNDPNDITLRNHWLEKQRLLINAKKSNGK